MRSFILFLLLAGPCSADSFDDWFGMLSQDLAKCLKGAYQTDGVNDFIEINDITASISDLDSDFSISLWLNINAIGSTEYLFGLGNSSGGNHLVGVDVTAGGVLEVVCRDANNNKAEVESGSISTGVWRNAVLVWDASLNTVSGYLDGVTTGSHQNNSVGSATFNRASIAALTRSTTSFYFGGSVSEVRVYSEALTSTKIMDLFEEATEPDDSNLEGWWEMDGNPNDSTVNGYHGTVFGGATNTTEKAYLPPCAPR